MEHFSGSEWTPVFTLLIKGLGASTMAGIFLKHFFQWLSKREVRIPKGDKEYVFKGIGCGRQARKLIEKLTTEINGKKLPK